jgi:uncharacterized metal-binding protein YceD (DUF177 family)
MTQEFSRRVAVERIGPTARPTGHGIGVGDDITVEADATELAGLATRLQLPAISTLTCRFRLRPMPDGTITAEGWLDAVVTQTCVVSLDEFAAPVRDHFVIRFVPAGSESDDIDPDSDDEVPYSDGVLDLGDVAAEQLALALDPWPRKPDATLPEAATDEPISPFAALRQKRLPV